ncbi:FAD/NAD(P)-binding domain-containing protein [Aspergillus ellipticus CBS 707.79]|uniref:FAD/NAD(P)-binding domain-containing protein n=1 Tax=Aspergillus ellipticus CBS 707.79 TaxID=1448320 RepID=A0A319DAB0_9EURO|nr:FAD/NAD(P)-binding domain-containing protein [Aspergillus ellipticus CBS 707.79]
MSIPSECDVLIVGGGPAGSYTAAVLALEGVDTVVLEAEKFPRYHIGESLLPSVRYFMDFIDLYDTFNNYGFLRKNGATFKFNSRLPGYTNFVAAGGAGNHAWNVLRSEADNIMFRHAETCGAKVFDGVKVGSIQFEEKASSGQDFQLGRPVHATWTQDGGGSGEFRFRYLVDASGRAGIISTKHMQNRQYNTGLKGMATWGYWEGAGTYGPGIGDPFSEALNDGSGWAWFIPLHDGTVSVGVTVKQDRIAQKKKNCESTSSLDFYLKCLKETPGIAGLLEEATLKSDIRCTSDWSYGATQYASPYLRIVGDAGCFIDPLFSSGIHLAMASGLSAAATICASMRGDCTEEEAALWHTRKIAEGYTRFLLVVSSSMKQIHGREQNLLNDLDEPGMDRAFEHFKPIIQGTVDTGGKMTKSDLQKSIEFCTAVIEKVEGGCFKDRVLSDDKPGAERGAAADVEEDKQCDETLMKLVRMNRVLDIDNFKVDVVNGMAPNVKRGSLGLVRVD